MALEVYRYETQYAIILPLIELQLLHPFIHEFQSLGGFIYNFFHILENNWSLQMDLNYFFFSKSAYFETVIISWVTRAGFIHCFLTFLYLISKKILHLKISVLLRKAVVKNEEEILFEIEIVSTKTYC